MQFTTTLVCIGAVLAVLTASVWRAPATSHTSMDEGTHRRLRAFLGDAIDVPPHALVISEESEPKGSAVLQAHFLSDSVTCIVVRDLAFVQHKLAVFQQAHKWLTSGGQLLVVPFTPLVSRGDIRVTTRTYGNIYKEFIHYNGQTACTTRSIYPESDQTLFEMAHTAGFALIIRDLIWTFRKA